VVSTIYFRIKKLNEIPFLSFFLIVEFATIQLNAEGKVVYNLFKPDEIDAMLKEYNLGGNSTEDETT
jgi:hypothetical protein